VDPAGAMDDLLAGNDLGRPGQPAQPRCLVERPAAITTFHGHRLARIQADPNRQRDARVGQCLVHESILKIDGRPDGLTGRRENRERLVASELDDGAAAPIDGLAGDPGEFRRQLPGCLVPALLREHGVAAHVGDEKRPDLGRLLVCGPAIWTVHATSLGGSWRKYRWSLIKK